MTPSWQRNVTGLRLHAQHRNEETHRRAEEALAQLLKENRPVNFRTVAQTAGISTSWLYGDDDLKQRITHLRVQQTPVVQVKIPKQEQASSASKDTMISALQKRVREQADEITQLKRQVEVAYGLLHQAQESKTGK